MQGVYEIVNLYDGKATTYVGSSSDVARRWGDHCVRLRNGVHENCYLQRAWAKYGEEAFFFTIIEEMDDEAILLEREQYWLDRFLEWPEAIYNIAHDVNGGAMTEETKQRISNALKGYPKSEITKRKLSVARKGKKLSIEHRHKLSEAKIGKKRGPRSEETKRKISEAKKGKKHGPMSEEHKRKIGEAKKGNQNCLGRHHTEESKRKLSEAHKGRKATQEAKHNMSIAQKARRQKEREHA